MITSMWTEYAFHLCLSIAVIVSLNLWLLIGCGKKEKVVTVSTVDGREDVSIQKAQSHVSLKPIPSEDPPKVAAEPLRPTPFHADVESSSSKPLPSSMISPVERNTNEIKNRLERSYNSIRLDDGTSPRSKRPAAESTKAKTHSRTHSRTRSKTHSKTHSKKSDPKSMKSSKSKKDRSSFSKSRKTPDSNAGLKNQSISRLKDSVSPKSKRPSKMSRLLRAPRTKTQ